MMKKKDPNYVAKIEQAIEKKYGKEAIEHPRKNWTEEKEKKYLEESKNLFNKKRHKREKSEKVEKDGFLISKKLLTKRSNRTCPVCSVYSFNINDDVYMNKYSCCYDCFIKHVEGRKDRWETGWRPNIGDK